ncbi:hypothetical protein MRB53_026331 [Persea americana]|uniref:Uncharacterized protein n=1 Tax=Persea americana TaxID=3435 RepID=A0ACC2LI19_PERAE|nr:hypothetical protein MRB53_026331 [Persea americana]
MLFNPLIYNGLLQPRSLFCKLRFCDLLRSIGANPKRMTWPPASLCCNRVFFYVSSCGLRLEPSLVSYSGDEKPIFGTDLLPHRRRGCAPLLSPSSSLTKSIVVRISFSACC